MVDLTGLAKGQGGDDPGWAAPDLDDSAWPTYPFPSAAGWTALGGGAQNRVRWHRIGFDWPEGATLTRPALVLGSVSGADRVFLNGVEIGGRANLDVPYTLAETNNWTKAWTRLYRFDPGLLKPGENVLAIRLARGIGNDAGVLTGPAAIADYGVATDLAAPDRTRVSIFSISLIAIYVSIALVLLTAMALGVRDRVLTLFFAIYILPAASLVLFSPLMQDAGVRLPPVPEIYAQRLTGVGTLLLLDFVALVLGVRIPRWVRAIQLTALGLLAIFPYDDGGFLVASRYPRFLLFMLLLLLLVAVLSYWSIRAGLQGQRTAWPLLAGIGSTFAAIFTEYTIDRATVQAFTGHAPSDFGITVFFLCLGVVVAQNFLQAKAKLSAAQASIMRAHEIERRRIARDMHDGVGQWLSTIKLNLQMLRRQQREQDTVGFSEVLDHIDDAISDTRRIAHDLSPVMIEREGLATALKSHADKISGAGIKIEVDADPVPVLSSTDQGHIFRIFQEAVQNAIRHGRASKIHVTLLAGARNATLRVSDDGAGFDAKRPDQAGIGLASIRERAALLNAECSIESKAGTGTELCLKVPLAGRAPSSTGGMDASR
ncbi:MAG: sensor histidine kinase [Pseudomonadota bacterium]